MATGLPWRDVISDPLLMFKTDALVFFFIVELRVLYIFWIRMSYQTHKLQMFSTILWVVFSLS